MRAARAPASSMLEAASRMGPGRHASASMWTQTTYQPACGAVLVNNACRFKCHKQRRALWPRDRAAAHASSPASKRIFLESAPCRGWSIQAPSHRIASHRPACLPSPLRRWRRGWPSALCCGSRRWTTAACGRWWRRRTYSTSSRARRARSSRRQAPPARPLVQHAACSMAGARLGLLACLSESVHKCGSLELSAMAAVCYPFRARRLY